MKDIDFELLYEYTKKPELYTKSTALFWDDEHISKGMLEAHLDPVFEGASRKHTFIDASFNWIFDFCELGKETKVLDLGCGPGLYAEKFASRGCKVTGIDYSRRSVSYAREQSLKRGLNIEYIYQNYLEIDYESSYDLALIIYCDMGVFSDAERDIFMNKVYKALKPGGLFIFDIFTPMRYKEVAKESHEWEVEEAGFWRPDKHICLSSHFIYPEHNTHMNQVIVIDKTGQVEAYRLWDHVYTRDTIEKVLLKHGFKNIQFFSDAAGKAYSSESETLCVVAEK